MLPELHKRGESNPRVGDGLTTVKQPKLWSSQRFLDPACNFERLSCVTSAICSLSFFLRRSFTLLARFLHRKRLVPFLQLLVQLLKADLNRRNL